jgi:hypothetical protein
MKSLDAKLWGNSALCFFVVTKEGWANANAIVSELSEWDCEYSADRRWKCKGECVGGDSESVDV